MVMWKIDEDNNDDDDDKNNGNVSNGAKLRNVFENARQMLVSTLATRRESIMSSLIQDNQPRMCHDQTLQMEQNSFDVQVQKLVGDSFSVHLLEECLACDSNNHRVHSFSRISRVEQLDSWDCGLACLLMILRWSRVNDTTATAETQTEIALPHFMSDDESRHYNSLRVAIDSESIWTADLVYQLDSLFIETSVRYWFCSRTFEVKCDYKDIGYYQAAFGSDQERVSAIFEKLVTNSPSNLQCTPHGLSLDTVLNAACHSNCVALVLVDNAILQRKYAYQDSLDGETCSYVGHYVILCGISRDPDHTRLAIELDNCKKEEMEQNGDNTADLEYCVVLCDPGQGNPPWSFVTPDRFERARRAKGTDEDIIFFAKSCM